MVTEGGRWAQIWISHLSMLSAHANHRREFLTISFHNAFNLICNDFRHHCFAIRSPGVQLEHRGDLETLWRALKTCQNVAVLIRWSAIFFPSTSSGCWRNKQKYALESVIYARQHGCVYLDQQYGVHFGFETVYITYIVIVNNSKYVCRVRIMFHVRNNFHVSKACPVEMVRDDTSKANDLMDLCYHAIVHWNLLIQ